MFSTGSRQVIGTSWSTKDGSRKIPQSPTQTDSNTTVLSKSGSSSIAVLSKNSSDISFLSEKLSAPDVAVSPGALLPTSSGSDIVAITDSGSEQPDGLAFSAVELLKILPPRCKYLSGIVYRLTRRLRQIHCINNGNLPKPCSEPSVNWHFALCISFRSCFVIFYLFNHISISMFQWL